MLSCISLHCVQLEELERSLKIFLFFWWTEVHQSPWTMICSHLKVHMGIMIGTLIYWAVAQNHFYVSSLLQNIMSCYASNFETAIKFDISTSTYEKLVNLNWFNPTIRHLPVFGLSRAIYLFFYLPVPLYSTNPVSSVFMTLSPSSPPFAWQWWHKRLATSMHSGNPSAKC